MNATTIPAVFLVIIILALSKKTNLRNVLLVSVFVSEMNYFVAFAENEFKVRTTQSQKSFLQHKVPSSCYTSIAMYQLLWTKKNQQIGCVLVRQYNCNCSLQCYSSNTPGTNLWWTMNHIFQGQTWSKAVISEIKSQPKFRGQNLHCEDSRENNHQVKNSQSRQINTTATFVKLLVHCGKKNETVTNCSKYGKECENNEQNILEGLISFHFHPIVNLLWLNRQKFWLQRSTLFQRSWHIPAKDMTLVFRLVNFFVRTIWSPPWLSNHKWK